MFVLFVLWLRQLIVNEGRRLFDKFGDNGTMDFSAFEKWFVLNKTACTPQETREMFSKIDGNCLFIFLDEVVF
jgi:hypothetical protein